MMVYLVDDDSAVRRALGRLLRAAGHEVAVFASGTEFLASLDGVSPSCVVLDMAMPGYSGLDVQESLLAEGNLMPIIFLTGRADVPMCAKAMKRGAVDFLTKPVEEGNLLAAVSSALETSRQGNEERAERDVVRQRLARLTPREREVLDLVITGQLNKQIAAELGATEKTIKVHRGRVMEKMGVRSVAELVRLVARAGA